MKRPDIGPSADAASSGLYQFMSAEARREGIAIVTRRIANHSYPEYSSTGEK
jgi:hypothetical protein